MIPIEGCITFLLGKAYQHVNQAAKQRLGPYGVTPVQFALLNVLWENDGLSGAAICARLQLDSATVTGVIDRLEHLGLVERRPDSNDRRINEIYLTAQGHALREPLSREIEELNREFLSQLKPADAETLRAVLAALGHVKPSAG